VSQARCGAQTTVLKAEERVVRPHRLIREDVEACRGEMAAFQGFQERILVDQFAARGIHEGETQCQQNRGKIPALGAAAEPDR
jgi:hypothetical protein